MSIKRIAYSKRICERVYALRSGTLIEVADLIQREFKLDSRPSRYTIARIIQRKGEPLVHPKRIETNV